MRKTLAVLIALTTILAAGCGQQADAGSAPAPAAVSAPPAVPAASPASPAPGQLTGKVLETIDGGGYTYVRLATPGGEEWAAIRQTSLEKGATVSIAAQMTMEKFASPTLNRTFDRIIFGDLASGAPAAMGGTPAQHMQVPPATDVKVEKAAGGMTVAEIWAGKQSLAGKEVVVRGKVVKFRAQIMGVNWLHLQDGTGSAASGDNDLTVTTSEVVKPGDEVTVRGIVAADKDFGAGYLYPVILEKSVLVGANR